MSINDLFSLSGKVAIVTGAASGIGATLAQALATAGADVAVADLNLVQAQETAEQICAEGQKAKAFQVDVTQGAAVKRMVAEVLRTWDQLDIAINSAGIAKRSPAEDISEEDWDAVLDVDLKGVYLCTQAEANVMLAQGSGSIINIASMSASIVNRPQLHAHYNAAKAGVVQFSRSCAAEWAGRGVRVNTLSPGHTQTPMTAQAIPGMGEVWRFNTPMGRLGTPEDLIGATLFLASAASNYVTGLDLIVDGGYTLW